MDSQRRSQLVGIAELADMLGLSKPAAIRRSQKADFPAPLARLASGPVWDAADVGAYARERSSRYYERPGVERLAAASSEDETLTLEETAGILNVSVLALRTAAEAFPGMPGNWNLATGELRRIRRRDLGLYARALAVPLLVEVA